VEEDGGENINAIPEGTSPVSMGQLSKDSEIQSKQMELGLINAKSSRRKFTIETSEAKSLPCNSKERLEGVSRGLTLKNGYTEHYQNAIFRLNPKKVWKKRDNGSINDSRDLTVLSPKVLIVEDNQFNVFPIKKTLDRNHIEFDWAKNGLDAVEKYNKAMKES